MTNEEKIHISAVIPVYGCALCLPELYNRLSSSLEKINQNFEIIFVNDAGPDNAWPVIKNLAEKDKRVKGINLSRNWPTSGNFSRLSRVKRRMDCCNGL